ncbi:SufBD protein [Lacrimispora amygdalina]|uniref:SufBD protein n=1 Tax=Lacrimispora amygdalina TaxID=253257 RepID=A0A3E2NDS4_9FIRM|nr:SufBD protein [Clostridium indicum]RFZ79031.1 SufBD protein [Clostridium indicum]
MDQILELVCGLKDKNDKYAYQCLKKLESESLISDKVYPYFDLFAELSDHPNSYFRTRGIILIAANAKWDRENKIDGIIDQLLKHVEDEKPITARQCIKVLPLVAQYKPELANDISMALRNANTQMFKDSMQPLVNKDIKEALNRIDGIKR